MISSESQEFFVKNGDDYPYFLCHDLKIPFSVSLENSKLAIKELDFTDLIEKMCQPSKFAIALWEKEAAVRAVGLYKNWLWLIRKFSEQYFPLPPSLEIDEIWHRHIFETHRYVWDCKAIFGLFLHHNPYPYKENIDTAADFENTKLLYKQEFGEDLPSLIVEEV